MTSASRWARRLVPLALLLVWLGIGGTLGPYAGKLSEVSTNDQAAFLPQGAESTRVLEAQKAFNQSETVPAIVVWTVADGQVARQQRADATRRLAALAETEGVAGTPSPALPSRDGKALQAVVPLEPNLGDELPTVLRDVRQAAQRVPSAEVQIAGHAPKAWRRREPSAGRGGPVRAIR